MHTRAARNLSGIFKFGVSLNKNLYVGNLSWECTDNDLKTLFADYGDVVSARVIEDRETGRSRGFGFVEMDANGAAEAISALDGSSFKGRDLKVNESRPREARPRY